MGKASKQLIESINECYKEEEIDNYNEDNEEGYLEDEILDNEEDIKLFMEELKSHILDYCKNNGVNICEFLHTEDLELFLYNL
tara:strand:+ start:1310 stop:1558 length:249 start_codon:yes stop_codon:yes gene_type:complete